MSYFGIPIRNGIGIGLRSYVGLEAKAPAWTPAAIPTALWLDASDAGTITLNGATVSQWADKSGNSANALQSTAANQPSWGVAQNLLVYSEQIGAAGWGLVNVTIASDQIESPIGTLTADKLQENTITSFHMVRQTVSFAASTQYTASAYFKKAERDIVYLNAFVGGVGGVLIYANLTTGTVAQTSASVWTINSTAVTLVTDGWYRVSITFTPTTTAIGLMDFALSPAAGTTQYAGTSGFGAYLWGAQMQQGALGPYQQTTSAPFTVDANLNGKPSVSFDGINDVMSLPNGTIPAGDSNYTMYICMELGKLADQFFVGTAPSALGATGNWLGIISTSVVGNWWFGYGVSSGVTQVGQDIYGAWYDSSVSTSYFARNGGTVAQQVQAVDRASLTTQQWVGGNGTANNQQTQAKIAEIVVTSSILTTENRQKLEGYFAWKWGMTSKLPANHPYKNIPPTL